MNRIVAVYARISADQEGLGLGVARQEADCRELATKRGWSVYRAYIDQSVSAYKRVKRPAFEDMLADLEAGALQGIVVYDVDRIARQPRDLERLIDIFETRDLVMATVQGDLNLGTSDGRFIARLLVNVANKSSADTARRVARKHLELAQQGKLSGGGTRAFGYESDQLTVRESEAVVIKDVAQRVLAGESLTSICRSLDGVIPTPKGGARWDRGTLKRSLIGPRTAGFRVYHGSVILGADGPVRGEWPAILDVPTWEAVRAVLTDKSRDLSNGRIDRKYLLSGFLRCKCGAKMYGVFKKGAPQYACPVGKGCGNTCRKGEPIDAHITELVLRYLESQDIEPDDTRHRSDIEPLGVDIAEAEQSLANLIAEWDAGRMSDQVFFAAQAKKEASLNTLKRSRAQERRKRTLAAPIGEGVREVWAAANLSQRRAILSDVLLAVQVLPKPATAPKKFDAHYYVPVPRPSVSL